MYKHALTRTHTRELRIHAKSLSIVLEALRIYTDTHEHTPTHTPTHTLTHTHTDSHTHTHPHTHAHTHTYTHTILDLNIRTQALTIALKARRRHSRGSLGAHFQSHGRLAHGEHR